jgi:geranylgeranyl diphosphate synthase, type II
MKKQIQEFLLSRANMLEASSLKEAVQYALSAGGKRFRPLIVLTVIEGYGLDPIPYIPLASALEMIHVYSLIHDDLPAMDNDDLRHGVNTLHLAFDEATAILVGDALLTDAFGIVSESKLLPSEVLLDIVKLLAKKAGYFGMVYGQHLDIIHEKKVANLEMLKTISKYKTGQLMEAAFVMGAMIAAPKDVEVWSKIGLTLGLIFQIQDDVLEATTSVENMQKSKSDEILNKATFVSQSSVEEAKALIQQFTSEVDTQLSKLHLKNNAVLTLIEMIKNRTY